MVDISKDSKTKNEQRQHIMEQFVKVMVRGDYRRKDQCISKFREMKKMVTKFNDIYNNLITQRKMGKTFNKFSRWGLNFLLIIIRGLLKVIDVWIFLFAPPKWVKEYGSKEGGEKRTKVSKTSYSTLLLYEHFAVDLNEVDELELEDVVRLMGRGKEKERVFVKYVGN